VFKCVTVDGIILFGSHAKNLAHTESDIDLAILSRQFGKDRISEDALVNIHAHRAHLKAEAVPISVSEWFSREFVSPILHEIKKDAVILI
jgi:predicted nucleotidyltransferase